MGLDAAVYRRDDPDHDGEPLVDRRVGNSAMVGYLRTQTSHVLPPTSITLSRVLYSGTHSGDEIEPDLFAELLAETEILEKVVDSHVAAYCASIRTLIKAALAEGVSIAF